jgi:uncharacterized protein (DUF433 family)
MRRNSSKPGVGTKMGTVKFRRDWYLVRCIVQEHPLLAFPRPRSDRPAVGLRGKSMTTYIEQREGGYYVAETRVSLDSLVYAFRSGESPETIQQQFPTLSLGQVYSAIAFYLAIRLRLMPTSGKAKVWSTRPLHR